MSGSIVTAIPTLVQRLKEKHPDARYELNYENPFQLLIATILAAQATDERINKVTPGLFAKYADARAFAEADRGQLEQDLKPTGFYRNKAKAVQECSKALVERFGGEVPPRMEDLVTLPGVARKTANVVLNNAFRIPSGVIVDTHVQRVSQRMGLSTQTKPERIEQDLMRLVPQEEWVQFGPALVLHGRYTCTFNHPKCDQCVFSDLCPKLGVAVEGANDDDTDEDDEDLELAEETPSIPSLAATLPEGWRTILAEELSQPYFRELEKFVAAERSSKTVFPPAADVFHALHLTPFDSVKVLLLGQDPYHDDGQAHGLCFSVRPGMKPPPSLGNIFKEIQDDLGISPPDHGCLESWAKHGVLLLNAVLTVRAHEPASHKERGWERFTDAIIRTLSARAQPIVFLLWGAYAQHKKELIDTSRHVILESAHPSPLSAKKFLGSKPFSRANAALEQMGVAPIPWRIPSLAELRSGIASPPPPPLTPQPAPVSEAPTSEPEVGLAPPEPVVSPATPPSPAPAPSPTVASALPRLAELLPDDWRAVLADEVSRPYFRKLDRFLETELAAATVCPGEADLFRAFALTPWDAVKVVLVGSEPSAKPGTCHGLAYSTPPGLEPTRAVIRLLHELRQDLGCWLPRTGCLEPWCRKGVLLLNTVLSVRAGEPGSHRQRGWETFTEAVVRRLAAHPRPIVFFLFGPEGARLSRVIEGPANTILTLPDPSGDGFLGTRPFSAANNALERAGSTAVYWQIYAP